MTALSVPGLNAIEAPGRYGDGGGLYLNVSRPESKSWVQRIVVDGRCRDIGLGSYPAVSLEQARSLSAANRAAVAEGRDPLAEKRRAAVPTFREAALRVYEANLPRWRNGKHTSSWWQTLERHAMPRLGNLLWTGLIRGTCCPFWNRSGEFVRRRQGASARESGPSCPGDFPTGSSNETSPTTSLTAHYPVCRSRRPISGPYRMRKCARRWLP